MFAPLTSGQLPVTGGRAPATGGRAPESQRLQKVEFALVGSKAGASTTSYRWPESSQSPPHLLAYPYPRGIGMCQLYWS